MTTMSESEITDYTHLDLLKRYFHKVDQHIKYQLRYCYHIVMKLIVYSQRFEVCFFIGSIFGTEWYKWSLRTILHLFMVPLLIFFPFRL